MSRGGGIGRRVGLKNPWEIFSWGFKSLSRHNYLVLCEKALAFDLKTKHIISMVETIKELIISAFAVDSFGSIILRGVIWLAIAMVIIMSADAADPDKASKSLRSNLGFLLIFIVLTGGLIFLLFGFTKA